MMCSDLLIKLFLLLAYFFSSILHCINYYPLRTILVLKDGNQEMSTEKRKGPPRWHPQGKYCAIKPKLQ